MGLLRLSRVSSCPCSLPTPLGTHSLWRLFPWPLSGTELLGFPLVSREEEEGTGSPKGEHILSGLVFLLGWGVSWLHPFWLELCPTDRPCGKGSSLPSAIEMTKEGLPVGRVTDRQCLPWFRRGVRCMRLTADSCTASWGSPPTDKGPAPAGTRGTLLNVRDGDTRGICWVTP